MPADAECVAINAMDIDGVVDFREEKRSWTWCLLRRTTRWRPVWWMRWKKRASAAFGPRANAAIIESSKVFSKNLMKKYGIPTADYEVFSDPKEVAGVRGKSAASSRLSLRQTAWRLARALSSAQNFDEAKDAVHTIMEDKVFGASGNQVVVEEFLTGPEVSVLAFTDGKTRAPDGVL